MSLVSHVTYVTSQVQGGLLAWPRNHITLVQPTTCKDTCNRWRLLRCTVTWQVKVTAVNSDVTYAPLLGSLMQAQRYYHNIAKSQLFFKYFCTRYQRIQLDSSHSYCLYCLLSSQREDSLVWSVASAPRFSVSLTTFADRGKHAAVRQRTSVGGRYLLGTPYPRRRYVT